MPDFKFLLLKVILPSIVLNLFLGFGLALILASMHWLVYSGTSSLGIYKSSTISIDRNILGGSVLSFVLLVNELLVLLMLFCLRKVVRKINPDLLVFFSSAVVGIILGLLFGLFATPVHFALHLEQPLPHQSTAMVKQAGDIIEIIARVLFSLIMSLIVGLVYGLVGCILAPINGLRKLALVKSAGS